MERSRAGPTLLESGLPFKELSKIAKADRYSRDPVYSVHRWWARRPPSTCRALLLAASMPADTPLDRFWEAFGAGVRPLRGWRVADPFMGGATSLVEAHRLGADVAGIDIDPLATLITLQELEGMAAEDFEGCARDLLQFLEDRCAGYYPVHEGGTPLHYFFFRRVTCPACQNAELMYKSLVLARDTGIAGAVVRNAELAAFCPDCLRVHHLDSSRSVLACCGRRRPIESGTYVGGRYVCSACGKASTHKILKTALAPRVLVAVEVTESGHRRSIRSAEKEDLRGIQRASEDLMQSPGLPIPRSPLPSNHEDGRPQLYGVVSAADMFTERQLLVLGLAFDWVRKRELSTRTQRALALALSNALATNNLFCSYATEYGRLAPLFSVRSYGLPVLSVELNPLHSTGGRGTITATLRRVARSSAAEVRRHSWDSKRRRVTDACFLGRGDGRIRVATRDARKTGWTRQSVDLILTDPPYFDYIPYSDLSQFFRSWLDVAGLLPSVASGEPLYPTGDSAKGDFSKGLGEAFGAMTGSLRDGGCIVFTYHSTSSDAWDALRDAIRKAGLTVTAAFPMWADAKSVGHNKNGNCEWDVCFVCRPSREGWRPATLDVQAWLKQTKGLAIGAPDATSWQLAVKAINDLRKEGK
jgi:putative DNA methylase